MLSLGDGCTSDSSWPRKLCKLQQLRVNEQEQNLTSHTQSDSPTLSTRFVDQFTNKGNYSALMSVWGNKEQLKWKKNLSATKQDRVTIARVDFLAPVYWLQLIAQLKDWLAVSTLATLGGDGLVLWWSLHMPLMGQTSLIVTPSRVKEDQLDGGSPCSIYLLLLGHLHGLYLQLLERL